MSTTISGGPVGITVETDPNALPLTGGTLSGTLSLPTVKNLLNAELVVDSYNDTGAGTHYIHKFTPFDGIFALATNGGGLKFPDGTVQTTRAVNFVGGALTANTSLSVNTTTPALVVTQDGTGDVVQFMDQTSDTSLMRIDANGAVYLGSSLSQTASYDSVSMRLYCSGPARVSTGVYSSLFKLDANVAATPNTTKGGISGIMLRDNVHYTSGNMAHTEYEKELVLAVLNADGTTSRVIIPCHVVTT